MVYYYPHLFSQFVIVSKNGTAISKSTEIFGWKKRSTTNMAKSSCLLGVATFRTGIISTNGLGVVFDNV